MFITDPVTKQPSVTLTAFVSGFLICSIKLLASDLTIHGFHVPTFSGSDFALAVGALGAIYTARKAFPGPDTSSTQ